MEDDPRRSATRGRLPLVMSEADLLPLALEAAARAGDPDPELIQHITGTREEVTKTTGSWVPSNEPSYLVAIRGKFAGRRLGPPSRSSEHRRHETESYSVIVLVVEINSGRITDSGGGPRYPDLATVGPVVTDYRRSS